MPVFEKICLSEPGLICCAGENPERFLSAAVRGDQGGMRPVTLSGLGTLPVGLVQDSLLSPVPGERDYAPSRLLRLIGAAMEQIRPSLEEALQRYGPQRVGVCVGSCDNASEWSLAAHRAYFQEGAFPPGYELRFPGAAWPAEYIVRNFGMQGPALGVATACASGAGAIIKGAELIRSGLCDAVLAGGVDLASETVLRGFHSLEAVSENLSNPFSKNRRGINPGEGAAFFVLSREPLRQEGKHVFLQGVGESADAYHITSPRPDGTGAIQAMEAALSNAGLEAADIGYLNLHGTGTIQNDAMEALAVAAVFGGAIPPLSSTKPVIGHTFGAAGALELALCWLVLQKGGEALPIHCWDGVQDENLPVLNFVAPGSAAPGIRFCMSNSFAFGGCNNSLIIGAGD
jgi:3-oxoacyl-[acyl-carrier-protein] synthase-1